ncbi:hypothetical protein CDQ91_06945 [Sphingopyxis witflariensis]|uniref:Uncharacterized protein n=1 Tax=Sphingopyxis witflariensis TaxID=173675 RepID=A0A246JYI1_9SPHN|nr:hypothetical protein CDQ91_06945 [Sphingopyxis witflariensis]
MKPLADFEPAPKRPCGLSEGCHICLAAAREDRIAFRQITEESAERMLAIQYGAQVDPTYEAPLSPIPEPHRKAAEHFRQSDEEARRRRLRQRK